MLATLLLGVAMALGIFYGALKLGRLTRPDAAAFAAHYGSASAVTFAAVVATLQRDDVAQEGFLPVLLVIIEVPAILVAFFFTDKAGRPAAAWATGRSCGR